MLSIAAPVVLYEHGRQVVRFQDFGLGSVVEGERRGLTVPLAQLQRGEKAVELRYCCSRRIDESDQPAWVEKRVMSMGLSPRTPVIDIVMPNLFRLTKHPEQLSWVHSRRLRAALGLGDGGESPDVFRQLMTDNLESFGADTGSGWLVPAEFASAGGMLVVKSNGINARTGGVVHVLPLTALKAALTRRRWSMRTAEEETQDARLDRIDQENGIGDVVDDSDIRGRRP